MNKYYILAVLISFVASLKLRILTQGVVSSSRRLMAATLIASGALAWFFLISVYLVNILTIIAPSPFWALTGQVLFVATGILSAILGGLVSQKIDRRKFLWSWIGLGVISTALLALCQGIVFSVVVSILLGLSLGLGLPSSLAFLADLTVIEERGRIAGSSILVTFIMAFLAMTIASILNSTLLVIVLLLIAIRSTSFFALVLEKTETTKTENETRLPKPDYKELSFYLFPWIMFVIASIVASNLIPSAEEFQWAITLGNLLRYAFIALFGFAWGVVADRNGRKQPVIIGLVLLGISFGLLGVSMEPISVFVYLALSGVAWASFLTIYLVIPGDLAIPYYREKSYALGTISPLIIMFSLVLLLSAAPPISSFSVSQILMIIIFLSIIPVWRAEETLPESKIRKRRMKERLEKLGKLIEESEKTNNQK